MTPPVKKMFSIFFILLTCLSLKAQSAPEITIIRDIVYGYSGGVELKLDLAKPAKGEGPFPVVFFFHGGGWQQGNKSHMHRWLRIFASEGYVSVSVAYRFAPEFKWPSQVEDAKAAIRFLRGNALAFDIDPDRLGTMGESAGGYLALMTGLTAPSDGLEGEGGSPGFSSSVQAVVSYFSATDFSGPARVLTPELQEEIQKYYNKSLSQVRADFTGTSDPDDPILKKISVLPYVDKNDPPVLIFQGDSDPFVSVDQARKLATRLEHSNVPHELIIVKGGGHGWTGSLQDETTRQMLEFFNRILKGK